MKAEDVLQSKVIDFLRFPTIVGIVLLHAFLESIKGLQIPDSGLPVYHTLSFLISRVFVFVAVPLFFFISGFLFFFRTSFSATSYKNKLQSRVRTLLLPYLFWNLIVLACQWGMALASPVDITSGAYKSVVDYSFWDYLRCFWNINGGEMPINGVLWFMRDLMIMVMCSPLVYCSIRYLRWYTLLLLGGIWITSATLPFLQMSAVFFFTLGAWFSINGRNFVSDFKLLYPWGFVLYLVYAFGTLATRFTSSFFYVSSAGILLGLTSFVALTAHFVEKGAWKASVFLTNSCFLVYAFHQLPLNMLNRILFRLIQPSQDWMFVLIYFASPAVIIAADLLVYALLKRFVPKFAAIITGGRS